MNVARVRAASGVIHAAMQQGRSLPESLAYALEAAGLLQSPESAAELVALRSRVDELEAEREHPAPLLVSTAVEACGTGLGPGYSCRRAADHDDECRPFADPAHTEAVTARVQNLRDLLARQRAAVEDPHDSPLHHTYLLSRDLPGEAR